MGRRTVRPAEVAAVTALSAPIRYEYFIKRVADGEEVWGLRSKDGWVIAADDDGRELIPAWSDAAYADACRSGEWTAAEATPIPLDEWLERWVPGLIADKRLVAVFPVNSGDTGTPADPLQLRSDLMKELEQY